MKNRLEEIRSTHSHLVHKIDLPDTAKLLEHRNKQIFKQKELKRKLRAFNDSVESVEEVVHSSRDTQISQQTGRLPFKKYSSPMPQNYASQVHLDQHQIDSDVLFASDVPTTEQENTEGTQNHSILTQSRAQTLTQNYFFDQNSSSSVIGQDQIDLSSEQQKKISSILNDINLDDKTKFIMLTALTGEIKQKLPSINFPRTHTERFYNGPGDNLGFSSTDKIIKVPVIRKKQKKLKPIKALKAQLEEVYLGSQVNIKSTVYVSDEEPLMQESFQKPRSISKKNRDINSPRRAVQQTEIGSPRFRTVNVNRTFNTTQKLEPVVNKNFQNTIIQFPKIVQSERKRLIPEKLKPIGKTEGSAEITSGRIRHNRGFSIPTKIADTQPVSSRREKCSEDYTQIEGQRKILKEDSLYEWDMDGRKYNKETGSLKRSIDQSQLGKHQNNDQKISPFDFTSNQTKQDQEVELVDGFIYTGPALDTLQILSNKQIIVSQSGHQIKFVPSIPLIDTGNDARSIGCQSMGISVQTQPDRRNGFNYAKSEKYTDIALSVMTEKVANIAFSSKAVSVVPVEVEKINMGHSAKTPSQAISVRDRYDQVTNGRFSPPNFDATIQTDHEIFVNYYHKKPAMCVGETLTEPVKFMSRPNQLKHCLMQTEPEIFEDLFLPENICYSLPEDATFNNLTQVLPRVKIERGIILDLPPVPVEEPQQLEEIVPQQPEEVVPQQKDLAVNDWSDSELYRNVSVSYIQQGLKNGTFKLLEGEKRPDTPESLRNVLPSMRAFYSLNPHRQNILKQVECSYLATKLIKHMELGTKENPPDLAVQHERSNLTIQALVHNMVEPEIKTEDFLDQYENISIKNVLKLLLRASQLYEARVSATKILTQFTEIEQIMKQRSLVWRILQDNTPQRLIESRLAHIKNLLLLVSRTLIDLTLFQTDLFKTEFMFRNAPLRMTLLKLSRIVLGFCVLKKELPQTMLVSGVIVQGDEDVKLQLLEYNEWLQESIKTTGILRVPDEQVVEAKIQRKVSRVEDVLANLKPRTNFDQLLGKRQPSQRRPITPIDDENMISSQKTLLVENSSREMLSPERPKFIEISKIDQKLRRNPTIILKNISMSSESEITGQGISSNPVLVIDELQPGYRNMQIMRQESLIMNSVKKAKTIKIKPQQPHIQNQKTYQNNYNFRSIQNESLKCESSNEGENSQYYQQTYSVDTPSLKNIRRLNMQSSNELTEFDDDLKLLERTDEILTRNEEIRLQLEAAAQSYQVRESVLSRSEFTLPMQQSEHIVTDEEMANGVNISTSKMSQMLEEKTTCEQLVVTIGEIRNVV